MLKYLTAWFLMLLVSIVNGAVRDFTYGLYMAELKAHQLSTITGVLLLSIIIWGYVRVYRPSSGQKAIFIGLLWMGLTVAFEFLFFHYAGGHSWSELFANYNIFKGRVWVVLLAWVATAPYVFFRLSQPA